MGCDFLIIGGGIAGTSAGAELANHGHVVLWEAESHLGYHASGRSAALFEQNYGLPETVALNIASFEAHKRDGVLSPRGLMLVSQQQTHDQFKKDVQVMLLAEITDAEAHAMVPVLKDDADLRFGYHAEAWDLDTERMLQHRVKRIKTKGGSVQTGQKVSTIMREQNGWRVSAGHQDIFARYIVNAAGAWADEMAKLAGISPIGLSPLRRSMARVPAPMGVNCWPMIIGAGETWYAKPDAGALLISPADEVPSMPMDAWAEDEALATGIARYQEVADHQIKQLLANWAGLRTFAPDRRLVLGPDPEEPSFIWCAGQGGYGFQTAPAAAKLLVDLVLNKSSDFDAQTVAALQPDRFT